MPVVQNKPNIIFRQTDPWGNMMEITQEPEFGNCQVWIRLKEHMEYGKKVGSKWKQIAEWFSDKRILIVKRDRQKHYHYITKGYGFNWCLMQEGLPMPFKWIVLIESNAAPVTNYYLFTRENLISQSCKLKFEQNGYELQRFMPLAILENYKKTNIRYEPNKLVKLD